MNADERRSQMLSFVNFNFGARVPMTRKTSCRKKVVTTSASILFGTDKLFTGTLVARARYRYFFKSTKLMRDVGNCEVYTHR